MPDWKRYVRENMPPLELDSGREGEIVDEIAEHLGAIYDEAIAAGASDDDARARALAQVSDWRNFECELKRAETRGFKSLAADLGVGSLESAGGGKKRAGMMESMMSDLKYSLRVLMKHRGVTIVAVIALALGIGANTAIFSVVQALILRPLPYPELDRVVAVYELVRRDGNDHHELTVANYLDMRSQNRTFEHLALYRWWSVNLTGSDRPERVQGYLVTANLLDVLRIKPALGRGFLPDEDQAGKPRTVILSHGMWQRRFGGDPDIIGKNIGLNGVDRTVVGVMPPEFNYPRGAELISPLEFTPQLSSNRGSHAYLSIGRLKDGVTIRQAQEDMSEIARRLEAQYPSDNSGRGINVYPLLADSVRMYKPALLALMAAVGFVLLIACANVANLLLARAAGRHKEVAIRAALGARRGLIIRQMLIESVLLAVIGGALGVLLAIAGVNALKSAMPAEVFQFVPGMNNLTVDYRVLGFTLALSALTGILFGLVPAIQASKPDLNEMLKEGGERSSTGAKRNRALNSLVVVEVALSLILLIGAGLMIKSFIKLLKIDAGFRGDNVATMHILLPQAKYPQEAQRANFYRELLQRVSSMAGVESAAIVNYLPLGMSNSSNSFLVEGRPEPPPGQRVNGRYRVCSPRYFDTLGITLLKGRGFTDQDAENTPPVAVINETMAKRFWPGEDPIGKRFRFTGDPAQNPWMQIVGVIADVKHELNSPVQPEYYLPHAQDPWNSMALVSRTSSDPAAFFSMIRGEVLKIDRDQPVFDVRTMKEVRDRATIIQRFSVALLGIFAVIALILAAVGIYGVMSYQVSRRTHEIGIRMALGAQTRDVLKLVVRKGMMLALIGIAVGLLTSLAIAGLLKNEMADVIELDPVTMPMLGLFLAAIAFLACYLPARRASRMDPLIALRRE